MCGTLCHIFLTLKNKTQKVPSHTLKDVFDKIKAVWGRESVESVESVTIPAPNHFYMIAIAIAQQNRTKIYFENTERNPQRIPSENTQRTRSENILREHSENNQRIHSVNTHLICGAYLHSQDAMFQAVPALWIHFWWSCIHAVNDTYPWMASCMNYITGMYIVQRKCFFFRFTQERE